jgi:hypothetical protein
MDRRLHGEAHSVSQPVTSLWRSLQVTGPPECDSRHAGTSETQRDA